MKQVNLEGLTEAQLVERFAAIGVEQDNAELIDDNAKFTRLYWQMDAVEKELKSRPGDQRRELLTLFNHPNMQVRLMAAKATLGVRAGAITTYASGYSRITQAAAGRRRRHVPSESRPWNFCA